MSSIFNITGSKEGEALTQQNESCFPKLSYKDRLIGFGICVGLGYFIQIMSIGAFLSIIFGSPEKFAITYSLGNILSILGTSFLTGFRRQFKNMVDKERLVATIVFVASLVMTLVCALVLHLKLLVLLFMIVQMCAYIWYTASYIPFAQTCLKNSIKSCLSALGVK